MEEQIIKCPCGQVTHLVSIGGKECYDPKVHGSSAEAKGRCFNCQKPLAELEVKETQVVDEPVDSAADDVVELKEMSKQGLHELAEQLRIDVPANLGKKKLIKRIEEFQTANVEASEDDTAE